MLDELGITSLAGSRRGQTQRGSPYLHRSGKPKAGERSCCTCMCWMEGHSPYTMFAARDEMAVLNHKSLPGSEAERRAGLLMKLEDSEAAT